MSITKRGNRWQVSLGSGKDRLREMFDTQQAAINRQLELTVRKLGEAHKEYRGEPSESTTLSLLATMVYHAQWIDQKSGVKTLANAQLCIDFLGENLTVAEVTPAKLTELAKHFKDLGNCGSTQNRKMSALSVMLTYAVDHGLLKSRFKTPKRRESEHRVRFLTPEEEQTIHNYSNKFGITELGDFVAFSCDTGFRTSEALNIKMRDCDTGYAFLHITKNESARSVPLTSRCVEIVARRKALGYTELFPDLNLHKLRQRWNAMKLVLGFIDDAQFIPYVTRHTCASRLAMANKNAPFIMTWMGHKTILTTQKYMHFSTSALLDGVSALEAYQPAGRPRLVAVS